MSGDRYVVAGLAHVRSAWFTEVARWATVGSVPVEFVKCVSAEELRARLATGRRFSAVLLDARLPAVDRDLLAATAHHGAAPIVVGGATGTSWSDLGAAAVLDAPFDRAALLDALVLTARPVSTVEGTDRTVEADRSAPRRWRAPLVAVLGRPGAGTSTVAVALAQALGQDPRTAGDVVLADLARHAHQAILHDARDVVPGIQELVEAHRGEPPSAEAVRALLFSVPGRGYELLLGLRRHRDWVAVRSHAFGAALDGLRAACRLVVAEVDHELESEAETGSFDIEDRNLMARRACTEADLVVVVGVPTSTGIHGLVQQLADLRRHGVDGERTLVVLNRAPRRPRGRAELTATLADLTAGRADEDPHLGPVFVSERRGVDELHRDLARFPTALTGPLGTAVAAALDRLPDPSARDRPDPEPVAVVPGSLGHWREGDPSDP